MLEARQHTQQQNMLPSQLYFFLSIGCTCLCRGGVTASTTRHDDKVDPRFTRRRPSTRTQTNKLSSRAPYLRSRLLEETSEFGVQLYLDLQFLGNEAASQMESGDVNTLAIQRFCSAVHKQVRREAWISVKFCLLHRLSLTENCRLRPCNAA